MRSSTRNAPVRHVARLAHPNAARAEVLLGGLTLREKIGQMVQPTAAARTHGGCFLVRSGSVLSSGGSTPEPNTVAAWPRWWRPSRTRPCVRERAFHCFTASMPSRAQRRRGRDHLSAQYWLGATGTRISSVALRELPPKKSQPLKSTGPLPRCSPCTVNAGQNYESFGESPRSQKRSALLPSWAYKASCQEDPTPDSRDGETLRGDVGRLGGTGGYVISDPELRRLHLARSYAPLPRRLAA